MVISDGAEIPKRLPRAMPTPTKHIIDWIHIAMKVRPMQQIADHMVRSQFDLVETLPAIDSIIGQLQLLRENDLCAGRLHNLGSQPLTRRRWSPILPGATLPVAR
jgi:hypothetical protein